MYVKKKAFILCLTRPIKIQFGAFEIKINKMIVQIEKNLKQKNLKQTYQQNLKQLIERIRKTTDTFKSEDIPWPCSGSIEDMVNVLLFDVEDNSLRKEVREHQRFCILINLINRYPKD